MRRLPSVLAAILAFLPGILAGQQHPSLERGFDPEKVYQFGDVDSVNLLNRNLLLQIPIGGSYPLSQGFSYGLTLTYNSKAWDFTEVTDGQGQLRMRAVPERFGNAGLGWNLSLGLLVDRNDSRNDNDNFTWFYLSPDGADHKFYKGLHEAGSLTTDLCSPGPCYSRDGSYLRMRQISDVRREIDFPDGSVHTFEKVVTTDEWRITLINDAFPGANGLPDNDVRITYPTAGTPRWRIQDRWGRTQTVFFETDPANTAKKRVDRVEVSGPSGAVGLYDFSYLDGLVQRACGGFDNTQTKASLLSNVSVPGDSSWAMQYAAPSSPETCRAHGLITDLTLPTLGRIHWSWGDHGMPIPGCSFRDWFKTSVGVKQRRRFDRDGTDLGIWTYQSFLNLRTTPINPPIPCLERPDFSAPYQEIKVQVINPLGHTTVSYFSVLPSLEGLLPPPFKPDEYGLPFTRAVSTDGGTRFLSSEVYGCPASPVDGSLTCPALRQSFVRWEHDPVVITDCTAELNARCFDADRRQASEKTVYVDDANRFAATESSDYDGFGHYRTMATSGNFGAGDSRTVTTMYNPGNALPNPAKWILGTYTEQTVAEGDTQKNQFCFNANTGFLEKQRIYRVGTSPDAHDIVRVWEPDAQGNVASQKDYGGDLGSVPTADVCGLTLSGESYRIDHTWPDPLRPLDSRWQQTSKYVRANGTALSYLTRDETVDPMTGLVVQSRDSAGLVTDYQYDASATAARAVFPWRRARCSSTAWGGCSRRSSSCPVSGTCGRRATTGRATGLRSRSCSRTGRRPKRRST
jgi:hypothetical protein